MRSLFTKVAGVSHKNRNGTARQELIKRYCIKGRRVELRREPSNQYDPNAVAVFIVTRELLFFRKTYQIGYLNGELAETISAELAEGNTVRCSVADVTGESQGWPTRGVNLSITIHER